MPTTTLEPQNPISPPLLSEDEVQSFVSEGFYVSHELLSNDEIEELKADAPKLIRGDYVDPSSPLDLEGDESDEDLLQQVLCMHQPHFFSPVVEKYVKHPKVCSILSQITGAHIPFWDGSVKCMQSMYFIKPSGYQGQAWHQDEIYIPTRDRSLIGAWIALDDAVIENGCLWVLPRSHRSGVLYDQKPHGQNDQFDFAEESQGFDDSKEVPVEVKKGSVVFFNGYLLHRSKKNLSDHYRRVLVNHYMTTSSLLPWGNAGGESFAKLDRRPVVTVAGTDPYEDRGRTRPDTFHFRTRISTN
jgi:phytanoyl-CoA hydroxylase